MFAAEQKSKPQAATVAFHSFTTPTKTFRQLKFPPALDNAFSSFSF